MRFGMVDQEDLHSRRTTVMRYSLTLKKVPHGSRIEFAQTDMPGSNGCDRPRKTPAITMKHGQSPQINAITAHPHFNHFSQRIEIPSSIRIHHSFGIARGPGGIVDG